MKIVTREITPRLLTALGDTPAVMLVGPGRPGRARWCRAWPSDRIRPAYLSLDDLRTLDAARRDPVA